MLSYYCISNTLTLYYYIWLCKSGESLERVKPKLCQLIVNEFLSIFGGSYFLGE